MRAFVSPQPYGNKLSALVPCALYCCSGQWRLHPAAMVTVSMHVTAKRAEMIAPIHKQRRFHPAGVQGAQQRAQSDSMVDAKMFDGSCHGFVFLRSTNTIIYDLIGA